MPNPTTHDAQQVAGWIRQCLSQDKRPIGLFLGAGCPCSVTVSGSGGNESLIPAIAELTTAVSTEVDKGPHKAAHQTLLGHFTEDGRSKPNIEELLTHIRGLRSVAGDSCTVRDLSAKQLQDLDEEICKRIVAIVDQSLPLGVTNPYEQAAQWIRSTPRILPIEIFTTNYDLLMEQALERCRVPYFDGFVGAREPFFDPRTLEQPSIPNAWTRLWKLHGSINWTFNAERVLVRTGTGVKGGVAVIHPSHLKYEESRRMPYLAMLDRLRWFMAQPSAVLVVCGYSFGDQHINEVINEALRSNQTATAFAAMRSELSKRPEASRLASDTRNLSLLGRDGAVLGGIRAEWAVCPNDGNRLASAALKWTPVDPADKDSPLRPELQLGQFDRMGEFLAEIVGDGSRYQATV